jgi:hypothetical protein
VSYDLVVFEPKDAPPDKAAFLQWYELQTQWSEGHTYHDPSKTTANLSSWYAEMCRDFPDMNGPRADELADAEDNSRATGYAIGQSIIYADFRWSEAEAAYAAVRVLAVKHGVGFFNVSADDGEIWFPTIERTPDRTPISKLTLTLERQRAFKAPSAALVEAAVDWLQPAGGPGFLILEKDEGGNYAQVGGGKDACTVEWREYSDGDFQHWVVGLPSADRETNVEIPGNGTHFPVKANERLSNANVKVILSTFAHGLSRPQEFVWREITAELGGRTPPSPAKPWWQFWR